jgi:hypothetical protein
LLSFRFVLSEPEALDLSYSGESPTEGLVEGYAASLEVRSSKTLIQSQHRLFVKTREESFRNIPNSSNMRIAFEDGDLQACFPEMDCRSHATDTGADDADSLDL